MAQVIHNLYRIKQRFPGFRHHDLHSGNVLIRLFLGRIYNEVQNTKFSIPNGGVEAVMIDFGFSVFLESKTPGQWSQLQEHRYIEKVEDFTICLLLKHDVWPCSATSQQDWTTREELWNPTFQRNIFSKHKDQDVQIAGKCNHTPPGFWEAYPTPPTAPHNQMIRNVIKRPMVDSDSWHLNHESTRDN